MSQPIHPTSRRPVIGLTSSAHEISIGGEPYAIRYTPAVLDAAVLAAGGLPVHLPLLAGDQVGEALDLLDGIVLSGGCDVDPELYDAMRIEPRPVPDYEPARDEAERALIDAVLLDSTPVLGVCRGLQILNVHLGGSLIDDEGHHYQHVPKAGPTHALLIEPGSRLAGIVDSTSIEVNSIHNQSIGRLGADLVVAARSEDGVIEAIELAREDSWIVGVQWHPEAMVTDHELQHRLFVALVEQARLRAARRGS